MKPVLSLLDILVDDSGVFRLKEAVRENEEQINTHSQDLQRLQAEVAKLRLVLTSLAEILQESNLVNPAQVIAKMQEIDQREKLHVGVNPPETIDCPGCHHQHLAGFTRCIYCGESLIGSATGD